MMHEKPPLLVGHHDFSLVNRLDHLVRGFTVDRTSDGLSRAEDLLDPAGKVLGQGFVSHFARDLVDARDGSDICEGDKPEGHVVHVRRRYKKAGMGRGEARSAGVGATSKLRLTL